ncbi:MFS transporter [Alicyclobacillus kakegawensis]|uniref:MFS transporter n=1 Tax=Alicyclobacillus kakegawensis TaxID=392012 RepID=UPI0009FAA961|nr:MFS transporter [Alicyclobacillus kakegawensis]
MLISTMGTKEGLSPAARRSMVGGILSLLIDSYDIYLPAFVLPAAMGYFEPDSMPASTKVTLSTLIFTVTLLARPIGGPILGNFSDKIGRKKVTMIAAAGFTGTTCLIGALPGYAQWGYGAIAALIVLRLIDGIFLGGGYAGPVPLAMERSPKHLRALVAGMVAAGAPIAIVFINLVQLFALKNLTSAAFISWGWRVPFFFGGLIGILYIIYYMRVPELDMEKLNPERESIKQPIWQLLTGRNLKDLLQVLLLMSGMWFAAQMALSFMPGLLEGYLHQSPDQVSIIEMIANLATAAGMILYAVLSQKVGRKRLLFWVGISLAIGETLAFLFMVQFAKGDAGFFAVGSMAFIAFFLANAPLGTVVVYLNERFPVDVRGSGYGTAYTISLILPGLYSTWIFLLGKVVPYEYTALVLIILGGILFIIATLMGPETRDVELLSTASDSQMRY